MKALTNKKNLSVLYTQKHIHKSKVNNLVNPVMKAKMVLNAFLPLFYVFINKIRIKEQKKNPLKLIIIVFCHEELFSIFFLFLKRNDFIIYSSKRYK